MFSTREMLGLDSRPASAPVLSSELPAVDAVDGMSAGVVDMLFGLATSNGRPLAPDRSEPHPDAATSNGTSDARRRAVLLMQFLTHPGVSERGPQGYPMVLAPVLLQRNAAPRIEEANSRERAFGCHESADNLCLGFCVMHQPLLCTSDLPNCVSLMKRR